MEREPSCELMVFWRVTVGWNEDPPEELEVREGLLWSIETAMLATAQTAQGVEDATRRTCDYDDTSSMEKQLLGCGVGVAERLRLCTATCRRIARTRARRVAQGAESSVAVRNSGL